MFEKHRSLVHNQASIEEPVHSVGISQNGAMKLRKRYRNSTKRLENCQGVNVLFEALLYRCNIFSFFWEKINFAIIDLFKCVSWKFQ